VVTSGAHGGLERVVGVMSRKRIPVISLHAWKAHSGWVMEIEIDLTADEMSSAAAIIDREPCVVSVTPWHRGEDVGSLAV
jgi:hypothetical protein